MKKNVISKAYYNCLQNLPDDKFSNLRIIDSKAVHKNRDSSFVGAILSLEESLKTKIPRLLDAATNMQEDPAKIYNESTCLEFHRLLCHMLKSYKLALERLDDIVKKGKVIELPKVKAALNRVFIFGEYLRVMVRSSLVETHLQTITSSLDVNSAKSWTPQLDDDGVPQHEDDAVFKLLKPNSLRKGKPLLPWESYRDWLMLQVHYFDAANSLTSFVMRHDYPKISISILVPPRPERNMLSWIELLKSELYFPTRPGETAGKDLVTFLKEETPDFEVGDAFVLAQELNDDLIERRMVPEMESKIDELAGLVKKMTTTVECEYVNEISEGIEELKKHGVGDRLPQMQRVVDLLKSLMNRATFFSELKNDTLHSGIIPAGTYHCEAYIAALLALWEASRTGRSFDKMPDFAKGLTGFKKIKGVLAKIKASAFKFILRLNLFADFNHRVASIPSECLNDAARCVVTCSIC